MRVFERDNNVVEVAAQLPLGERKESERKWGVRDCLVPGNRQENRARKDVGGFGSGEP